ncbi:MAG: ABC transporter permease [Acidobacteria bacterium]|nr:MAG: ABC transporter permease [Acidobacteriota bacterium]
MIGRILRESFRRQKRRKAIALAAVAFGTAVAAALANVALDVGDKVSRELRSFGANLVVLPAGGGSRVLMAGEDLTALRGRSYLSSADILKVKQNFWKNNILAFAPFLDAPARLAGRPVLVRGTWFDRRIALDGGQKIVAGCRSLFPFWTVEGDWPDDLAGPKENVALAGRSLAEAFRLRPGSTIRLEGAGRAERSLRITGLLSTGGEEDGLLLVPLETAQALADLQAKVDRILVSALTTPENAVYERLAKDPRDLPPAEFEKWSCTPFVSSIASAIGNALPSSEVLPIRRVADSEGKVLGKIGSLMAMITLMAALGSALTVTSALTTGVLERRAEIGLLKALGAGDGGVITLFLAEAAVIGLAGGLLGGLLGLVLSRAIALSVFGAPGSMKGLSLLVAVGAALLITLCGCAVPVRRIARLRSAEVLRG